MSCAQSATARTQGGTLAQRAITPVHPNVRPGTSEIVIGAPKGTFLDYSGRSLVGVGGGGGCKGGPAGSLTIVSASEMRP